MNKRIGLILLALVVALLGVGLFLTACERQPQETPAAQGATRYSTEHTFHDSVVVTAAGTAMDVRGLSSVGIQAEGITTATITFQGTIDGSTWYAIQAVNQNDGSVATTTTADGLFMVPVAGLKQVRANLTSWTAGTVIVSGIGMPYPTGVDVADVSAVLGAATDPTYIGDINFGESLPAGSADMGIIHVQDADGDEAGICPSMEALKVKQAQKGICTCESIVGWVGSTDVSGIIADTNHRGPGTLSVEFDKDGATQAYATMALPIATAINGQAYGTHGRVEYYLYITGGDLATISSVYLGLGTDASNFFYWQTSVADLAAGWNHIHHVLSAVDGQVGDGADMSAITWVRLYVALSATGSTLTDMKIDDIRLTPIENMSLIDPHQEGIVGTFDVNDISAGTQTNDVAITMDGEAVDVTTSVDFTVTLDSEVVAVDATGQGDVPITLDGEAVDTELPAAAALADAAANPTVPTAGAADLLFNNTTWDRERNNYQVTAYASAAYTVSQWVELINYNARGAYIVVNITGIGLDQTMTVKAAVDDDASSQMDYIWSSAALTPTGRHTYLIYPGAGAAAEDVVETVSYPLPRNWNLAVVFNNSEPITFSIGVHYIN